MSHTLLKERESVLFMLPATLDRNGGVWKPVCRSLSSKYNVLRMSYDDSKSVFRDKLRWSEKGPVRLVVGVMPESAAMAHELDCDFLLVSDTVPEDQCESDERILIYRGEMKPAHLVAAIGEILRRTPDNFEYWVNRYAAFGIRRTVGSLHGREFLATTRDTKRKFEDQLRRNSVARALLDFGCGPGRFYGLLSKHCSQYYGADIVPSAISRARVRHPQGSFAVIRDGTIPFDSTSFNAIVTLTVLQHITDDNLLKETLRQFRSRISRNGVVVMYENIAERPHKMHIRFRGAREYASHLQEAGLRVEHVAARGQEFPSTRLADVDSYRSAREGELHAFFVARAQ